MTGKIVKVRLRLEVWMLQLMGVELGVEFLSDTG